MQHRNRTKQTTSLEDRRTAFEGNVRERALQLPHAPNGKSVLRRLGAPRRRIRKTGPVRESCNHQNNAAPPLGTSPRAQTYSQAGIETCSQVSSSKPAGADRKSTRLNSSYTWISYAVFCLKKKIFSKRKEINSNKFEIYHTNKKTHLIIFIK